MLFANADSASAFVGWSGACTGTGDCSVTMDGAKVTDLQVGSDKVTVRYDDSGNTRTLSADYCVCTIPMPVFARLKTNLPPAYTAAAANTPAMAAGKVGWQAERFWESEAQSIRSGIPRRDI